MANIITGVRFVCALGLLFCPAFSTGFTILYLTGGISDVLDGMVARHLKKETEFGAKFDTLADIFFIMIAMIKVVRTIVLPGWLFIWIACIAVIKCINVISGFITSYPRRLRTSAGGR